MGRNSDRSGSKWSGSECGSEFAWSGSERIGVDRRDFRRNSLGVDRSLFRFRCGVDRSLARERIGAGFEWIEVMFVECVELGS